MDGVILNATNSSNDIIEKLDKILEYTKSVAQQADTIQYQVSNTLQFELKKATSRANGYPYKLYQFEAKYNGSIRARVLTSTKDYNSIVYIMRSLHDYYNESGSFNGNHSMSTANLYISPVDSVLTNFQLQARKSATSNSLTSNNTILGHNYFKNSAGTITNGNVVLDTSIPVLKGEQVVFLLTSTTGEQTLTIQLYYDEVVIL